MGNETGFDFDGCLSIASFIFQLVALLMFSLNTSFMLMRFGESIPTMIRSSESAFIGMGMSLLCMSIICQIVLYYRRKRRIADTPLIIDESVKEAGKIPMSIGTGILANHNTAAL